MLGRPPPPRRALAAATLGAFYAILILPGPWLGIYPPALAWFALSIGLLLVRMWAYHAYTFWAMLWIIYRAFLLGRGGDWVGLALDLPLPAVSLFLLMTSTYREAARGS